MFYYSLTCLLFFLHLCFTHDLLKGPLDNFLHYILSKIIKLGTVKDNIAVDSLHTTAQFYNWCSFFCVIVYCD